MRKTAAVLTLLLGISLAVSGAELRCVGVLGNSGFAGASLLKMQPGGYPGGVAVDDELTLWHSAAPDRLERLSLDGRVLAAFRIEGGAMGHPQHNVRVALVGDYVLELQMDQGRLFVLRRDADPAEETMKPLALDPPLSFWYASGLGARGVEGRAIVDTGTAVHAVDPATGKTEKLFDLPGRVHEHGLEVAPDGTIFITGALGTLAFDAGGKQLRAGPGCYGRINWIPGGLVALTWGGVQRLPESLETVQALFWNAGQEMGRPGQVYPVAGDVVAFATEIGPVYLAHVSTERLDFFRRLGAITPVAVGLSSAGEVLVGAYGGLQVWRWTDRADTCPFASHDFKDWLACRQIVSRGQYTFGIKQSYRESEAMQVWAWPPTVYGLSWSNLQGERPPRPLGFALTEDGRAFFTSEKEPDLYVTTHNNQYLANNVKKAAWAGDNPLRQPTELAGWTRGRVAAADGGEVVLVEPTGEGYREAWRLSSWGDQPDQRFGSELHLTSSRDYLFVSDTQRHRVLVFDLASRRLLAQAGTTDQPGDGFGQFTQPAQIAANGLQVVVFDRGNQRLVQCELKP